MAAFESDARAAEPYLRRILGVVEGMREAGVIGEYVIGGSVAVIFHADPFFTEDMDVFAVLPETKGGLVTLAPVYAYLKERGYDLKKEHVIIEGFPVQFLPTGDPLEEEAFRSAVPFAVGPYRVRVMRAEYLLAIYAKLRRPKDWPKIDLLLKRARLDNGLFNGIILRYNLSGAWEKVQEILDEYTNRSKTGPGEA